MPKSITKQTPKWIQDVKPMWKAKGVDVLTMKESGPNRKSHVPKICPTKPKAQIQFPRGWTGAESHGKVRHIEEIIDNGKGKGQGKYAITSHATNVPQHNIAVKVQEGWCLPLNPPLYAHNTQNTVIYHQDDNVQSNKRNRTFLRANQ